MEKKFSYYWFVAGFLGIASCAFVWACDFCEDVGNTISQEIQRCDVAVIATPVVEDQKSEKETKSSADAGEDFRTVRFRVARFVKDLPTLQRGDEVSLQTNQTLKPDSRYFLIGFGKKQTSWAAPLEVAERAERYILDGLWAPKEGPGRIAFFVPFLDDPEPWVAEDAYKVFAKAPYDEIKEIREKLDREHLLTRLHDDRLLSRLRRLYATLLGICGRPEDAAVLKPFLDRSEKAYFESLDATIACYLTLTGPAGMDFVESRYFINQETDKRHTQAAIKALEFHMHTEKVIPRERLLTAAHYLLDRPDIADQIIDNLIGWEDWTVSDKMVKLFKMSDKETSFVRKPVIHYLKACPLPTSRPYIEELRRIDPQEVELAEITFTGSGRPPAPAPVLGVPAAETAPTEPPVALPKKEFIPPKTWEIKGFYATRMFVFAALFAAAAVALTAVWLLVRTPRR